MKRLVATITSLFLILYAKPSFCEGFERVQKKESNQPTWGQKFARLIGLNNYKRSYALVIGISNYKGYGYLPSENDPKKVAQYLFEEADFDYVHTLTDEKASKEKIEKLMVDFFPSELDSNDRFLFYWSGHGVTRSVREGKRGYLPLASTPDNKSYSRMVSMDDISRWDGLLEASQTLYILDSCFSGLAGGQHKGHARKLTTQQLTKPSRQILTAGREGEVALVFEDLGGSLFTVALLEGMRGAADTSSGNFERDGVISVNELELYVKKRVGWELDKRQSKLKKSRTMTPQLRDLDFSDGEFFFLTDSIIFSSPKPPAYAYPFPPYKIYSKSDNRTKNQKTTNYQRQHMNLAHCVRAFSPQHIPLFRGYNLDSQAQA
ncbi:MAG: hypothetical protein D3922_05870 [Candidatus Electrothrix sp. AR1]|nr:hypothetical protein [Candidatus Electrothrix sp. AR1]